MHDAQGDVTFGRFRMDSRRRALLVDGKPLPLHARAFDVLEYLVAHRESVLTRDEITAEVWRGMAIAENNLTVQMSALRRALAQHGGEGLIVTFAGRGYRFVGDVAETSPRSTPPTAAPETPATTPAAEIEHRPAANATPRRRYRRAYAAIACALALAASTGGALRLWRAPAPPPRLSIVVVPFRNLTGDPHEAYLADAITDDLDTELARALEMQVIGRDSAVNVDRRQLSIQQIGRELGVRYVLDGSLRKTDTGYSVNPHLNDALTGLQLWSVPFTVTKDRFGDLRDIIVRRIADELGSGLNTLESRRARQERPNDPDALDLYYQAGALLDSAVSTQNLQEAGRLLQEAINKQPDFADALAKFGWVLLRKAQIDVHADIEQDRQRAHFAIRRALEKDPANAAALAAYALELELAEKCPEAEHVAGEAVELMGSNLPALGILTNCAWEQGHFDAAAANLAAMDMIDPVSERHKGRQIMASRLAMLRGDATGAVSMLTDYAADHPDIDPAADPLEPSEFARVLLIGAYVLNGQLAEAKALYRSYSANFHNRSVWRVAALDTRAISSSPQNARFLNALTQAGMNMFADEAPVSGAACTPDSNDFTPTPEQLPPGGTTLQPTDMAAHFRNHDQVFVIDVGAGVAAYPGAKFADHGTAPEDIDSFVNETLRGRTTAETGLPVIVMDTGPFGCAGYLAAARLLGRHGENVAWYRGGEESWAQTGLPADDHRRY